MLLLELNDAWITDCTPPFLYSYLAYDQLAKQYFSFSLNWILTSFFLMLFTFLNIVITWQQVFIFQVLSQNAFAEWV